MDGAPQALDFRACERLCAAAEELALRRRDPAPSPEQRLESLRALMAAGWTPEMQDFAAERSSLVSLSSRGLFAERPEDAELFALALAAFPRLASNYPLIPDRHIERQSTWANHTVWTKLGSAQKADLLAKHSQELLGMPPESHGAARGGKDWLALACSALLPQAIASEGAPSRSAPASPGRAAASPWAIPAQDLERPWHGYFESAHWSSLRSERPRQARALALSLCALACVCMGAGCEALRPWMEHAAARAAESPGPLCGSLGPMPNRLCSSMLREAIRLDRPDLMLPLVAGMSMDPARAERASFEERPLGPSIRRWILDCSSERLGGATQSFSAGSSAAREILRGGRWSEPARAPEPPASDMPLLSRCAASGAGACWDALAAMSELPTDLASSHPQPIRLPSLPRLRARSEAARLAASASCAASAAHAKRSFEREIARAQALLASLPLPAELLRTLSGDPHAEPAKDWSGAPALAPESPAAREELMAQCSKALSKARAGKLATAWLPAEARWASRLMALGAKPSFLDGRLPAGEISKAAALYELGFGQGLASAMDAGELAVVERDALRAQGMQAPQAARKPRL